MRFNVFLLTVAIIIFEISCSTSVEPIKPNQPTTESTELEYAFFQNLNQLDIITNLSNYGPSIVHAGNLKEIVWLATESGGRHESFRIKIQDADETIWESETLITGYRECERVKINKPFFGNLNIQILRPNGTAYSVNISIIAIITR